MVAAWTEMIRQKRRCWWAAFGRKCSRACAIRRRLNACRIHLRAFDDEPLTCDDYEEAARCFNRCRQAGIAGANVDFLLCAVALRRDWKSSRPTPTSSRYAKHVPLRLYHARGGQALMALTHSSPIVSPGRAMITRWPALAAKLRGAGNKLFLVAVNENYGRLLGYAAQPRRQFPRRRRGPVKHEKEWTFARTGIACPSMSSLRRAVQEQFAGAARGPDSRPERCSSTARAAACRAAAASTARRACRPC